MSIGKVRKRIPRLVWISAVSGRHFPECSWGHDSISSCPGSLFLFLSALQPRVRNHYHLRPRTSYRAHYCQFTQELCLLLSRSHSARLRERGCRTRPQPPLTTSSLLAHRELGWGRLIVLGACIPQPRNSWAKLYLFFTADVPGGSSPGNGGNGVSRGFTGQSHLLLQLHGSLVFYICDFGFCWKDRTLLSLSDYCLAFWV